MFITLGDPRKHVWTYAIGISDSGVDNAAHYCPCAAIIGPDPPSFVSDYYNCESVEIMKMHTTLQTWCEMD